MGTLALKPSSWHAVQVQRSSIVFEQLHTRRCSMLLAYSSNRSSVLPPGQARLALKQVCRLAQTWYIGWSPQQLIEHMAHNCMFVLLSQKLERRGNNMEGASRPTSHQQPPFKTAT